MQGHRHPPGGPHSPEPDNADRWAMALSSPSAILQKSQPVGQGPRSNCRLSSPSPSERASPDWSACLSSTWLAEIPGALSAKREHVAVGDFFDVLRGLRSSSHIRSPQNAQLVNLSPRGHPEARPSWLYCQEQLLDILMMSTTSEPRQLSPGQRVYSREELPPISTRCPWRGGFPLALPAFPCHLY